MGVYDSKFIKGLLADNPWWNQKPFPDIPEFRRSDFVHYVSELHEPKTNILLGPRRCGKTTLIRQIIQYLLREKRSDPRRILFVSLERPYFELMQDKIQEVIHYYEENILGHTLQDSKEIIYLFIDEAHFDPLWSRIFKQYVDQSIPVYAIISGSSPTVLYRDRETGAGRFHTHQMVTMKFRDVVRYRNPQHQDEISELSLYLRSALVETLKTHDVTHYLKAANKAMGLSNEKTDVIRSCYNEYLLKGGYPEFYKKTDWNKISRHYQTDVFDVILQKDVTRVSKIRIPQKVRTLMVLIAQNTAKLMTREKIARHLNVQPLTVDQYLDALAEAFLARTSAKFRKGKGYPSTSPKKYYAGDTGLRNAILGVDEIESSTEEQGHLLETAIFNHSLRLLFHCDHQVRNEGFYYGEESERDIVLDLRNQFNSILPVEVKNGLCGRDDIGKMKKTMFNLSSPYGLVICREPFGAEGNIMMVPPWIFLLSC